MGKTIKVFAVCFLLCFLSSCAMSGLFGKESEGTVYDTLCNNGYTGNEKDFLDSLKEETDREVKNWNNTESAYDKAVDKGYNGTKEDWLNTLVGEGADEDEYTDGKSIYEIAVDNGYDSTVDNWLELLKNPVELPIEESTVSITENLNTTSTADIEESHKVETTGVKTTEKDITKENVETIFTVTFKNYDGKLLKYDKVKRGENATPPPTPEREGYTFVGWDRAFNNVEYDIIVNAVFKKIDKPTIIVERIDSEAGANSVAVNIIVENNPGISSLNLNVAYDSALEFKKVEYNKDIGGNSMKPGSEDSPVKLVWVSPFEDVGGDWTFATLYFDVSDEATGDLPISVTYDVNNIYDIDEKNVYFQVIDGAIAISE